MPYNEDLVDRLREVLPQIDHFEEKKMFGGVAFLMEGKMCVWGSTKTC
ncbi:MAG: hypothetical protein ACI9BD_000529 [Candidatus Marinamargulisbacteria bacterium]|jgi:hypothetical protein